MWNPQNVYRITTGKPKENPPNVDPSSKKKRLKENRKKCYIKVFSEPDLPVITTSKYWSQSKFNEGEPSTALGPQRKFMTTFV